ncbi:hypothetical protein [uncultured Subdoligranulum sp.]|uniref:hypothetical protein n=1 Tax=uncultured Subdoligranulum sp. TaxID=512298 RepID=UPI00262FDDBD|nr:hypothetical protein [uncultured Subdoligranulum sp.]
MSYNNFVPKIWAEQINRELERAMVFAEDCNRQYEGDVRQMGDTVKVLGVGKPTITKQVGGSIVLKDPEAVEDTSVDMVINRVAYFNYLVDDIDRRQAVGGLMDALSAESSEGTANAMDEDIAALAGSADAPKLYKTTTAITVDNILKQIDLGVQKLMENDVKPETKIVITVPPWFKTILRQAYVQLDTNNSAMLKNGRVGQYDNVIVKMSNNCHRNSDNGHDIMLRTQRAVAFANPLTHVEPYRPEKRFADAVKGFVLYGTKIVRPKEMIVLNVKEGT